MQLLKDGEQECGFAGSVREKKITAVLSVATVIKT